MKDFGHGCICGTNGSGKTIGALNLANHACAAGAAIFFIDFKASLKTMKALRAVAEARGVPFYSFDLGIGSTDKTWYDPLGWGGKPSEMASLLMDSFTFQSAGAAEFYRGVAEQWLPLQLEVMETVGRRGIESKFDFLLSTATPLGLLDRMDPYRTGTDQQRAQYTLWKERMEGTKAEHLTALRNNLAKVVNSAGARLRPDEPGDKPLSFAEVARTGGIVYFAMSVADSTVLKTLGSLAIRDITTLSAERQRVENLSELRPVVMLVDEASRLAERATVMVDLFATAREALIWLWPITQSLSSYPETVQREIRTNALTWMVYRLQDADTAEQVTRSLGSIATETEVTETEVTHHFLRASESKGSGDSRVTLGERQHIPADAVLKTPNRLAYVWFTGTWSRATKEKWRNPRVKNDQVVFDAPLTMTVGLDIVIDPPEIPEQVRDFDDMVTPAENFFTPPPTAEVNDDPKPEVLTAPKGTSFADAPLLEEPVFIPEQEVVVNPAPTPAPRTVPAPTPAVAARPPVAEPKTVPAPTPVATPKAEPDRVTTGAATRPEPEAPAPTPTEEARPTAARRAKRPRPRHDPLFNPAPPGHPEYVPPAVRPVVEPSNGQQAQADADHLSADEAALIAQHRAAASKASSAQDTDSAPVPTHEQESPPPPDDADQWA